MLTIDRWRNWRPSPEKFEASPECELTKPTEALFVSFDGSTSEQTQYFSDPQAWSEDFIRWALERCALHEDHEDSAGIGCLLLDFAEWAIEHDAVPARRETFEALLQDAGLPLKDGMAVGIALKADVEAVLLFQAATEVGKPPAHPPSQGKRRYFRFD